MSTRNVAVMFTDIKGFTARVSGSAREDLSRLRATHERLLLPVFRHFDGHVVKTIGDAFLVRFDSPTDAVLCGLTIQEVLRQHNETAVEGERMEIRVAINSGEVEITKDDVFGETVNIAARLEQVAEAGEVWFTEAVYLAMNRQEAPSAEVGEHTFKGIPYPVRVYRASQEPGTVRDRLAKSVELTERGPVIDGRTHAGPASRRGLMVVIGAVVLVGAGVWWRLLPSEAEVAFEEATASMEEGRHAAALATLAPHLRDGDAAVRGLAEEAARARAEALRTEVNAGEALAWVRGTLDDHDWVDALRGEIPRLDGEATAAVIRTAENPWKPVEELLARYPQGFAAPYHAAVALEDMSFRPPCLALLKAAHERGAFREDPARRLRAVEVLDAALRDVGVGSVGWTSASELIIELLGPEEMRRRARADFARARTARTVEVAWRFLRRLEDPIVADDYHRTLAAMTDGFRDEEEADEILAFQVEVEDSGRREQILALHRFILEPTGSWGGAHRDLVRRNLAALEKRWGL